MGNKPDYLCSSDTGNSIPNGNSYSNSYTMKYFNEAFSDVLNLETEELSIYLLSILFTMSGFLLFIYGLFMKQLYQFIMGFIFLIPGFILDITGEPDALEKKALEKSQ